MRCDILYVSLHLFKVTCQKSEQKTDFRVAIKNLFLLYDVIYFINHIYLVTIYTINSIIYTCIMYIYI